MTRQDITAHFRGVVLVDQKCRLQIPIYNAHWMVSNIKSIKIPSKFQKKPIKSSVRSYFFIPTYFLTRTMTYTPRQMAPSRRSTPAWTELAVKAQECPRQRGWCRCGLALVGEGLHRNVLEQIKTKNR